jgi:hypothetical protein
MLHFLKEKFLRFKEMLHCRQEIILRFKIVGEGIALCIAITCYR